MAWYEGPSIDDVNRVREWLHISTDIWNAPIVHEEPREKPGVLQIGSFEGFSSVDIELNGGGDVEDSISEVSSKLFGNNPVGQCLLFRLDKGVFTWDESFRGSGPICGLDEVHLGLTGLLRD